MPSLLTVTETFEPDAPPAAVWAALASPPRWPEVLTDLREGLLEPPGALHPGASIRTFAKPGTQAVDMTYRVALAEAERRLTLNSEMASWRGTTDYMIEGDARARVTVTATIEALTFWPRLAVRLWRGVYTDQLRANVRVRTLDMMKLAETIAQER